MGIKLNKKPRADAQEVLPEAVISFSVFRPPLAGGGGENQRVMTIHIVHTFVIHYCKGMTNIWNFQIYFAGFG